MPSHPRKPRFSRAPSKSLRLTSRDLEILRHARRHRFLRSTHLAALLGGSRQATLRRLGLLFHHGYLDRPRQQLEWYANGSEPMLYGLGQRGARELARLDSGPASGARWDTKNASATRPFIRHALAVAEVMVAFETACRGESPARLICQEEVLAGLPEGLRRGGSPLRWEVAFRWQGEAVRIGVEPDQVFGLRFGESVPRRREAYFFLEADRGTMPVKRKALARSSILRKLLAYEATWRQGIHRSALGLPNFRVLTATTGRERARLLVEAARSLGSGPGLFLFSDARDISENILANPWKDGRGKEVRLLPPISA